MSQISILSTKTLSNEQRQAFLDADFDLLEQDFIEIKNNLLTVGVGFLGMGLAFYMLLKQLKNVQGETKNKK